MLSLAWKFHRLDNSIFIECTTFVAFNQTIYSLENKTFVSSAASCDKHDNLMDYNNYGYFETYNLCILVSAQCTIYYLRIKFSTRFTEYEYILNKAWGYNGRNDMRLTNKACNFVWITKQ